MKKLNRDIDFKIKISNNVFRVLINILILLFLYSSLIGDVGNFAYDYYLKNNILFSEIIRAVFYLGVILYAAYFAIDYIYYKEFKLNLNLSELLAISFVILASFNYITYYYETKNYKGFIIIGLILVLYIIRKVIYTVLYNKKINNKI